MVERVVVVLSTGLLITGYLSYEYFNMKFEGKIKMVFFSNVHQKYILITECIREVKVYVEMNKNPKIQVSYRF